VRIEPYYLVVERCGERPVENGFDGLTFGFLDEDGVRATASFPDRTLPVERLQRRLAEGKLCLAARHGDEVVGFHWIDLEECRIGALRLFSLAADEAYLFDGYTREAERGRGIAPALRRRAYAELEARGRTRCYSVSAAFNPAAIAFKRKLGAERVELGVYWCLFSRWRSHVVLRRYRA
jgi:GNAT superfamily N-acetyltransferase